MVENPTTMGFFPSKHQKSSFLGVWNEGSTIFQETPDIWQFLDAVYHPPPRSLHIRKFPPDSMMGIGFRWLPGVNLPGQTVKPQAMYFSTKWGIPGSSRYVKFLPFGRCFWWKGVHFTHLEDPGIGIVITSRDPWYKGTRWSICLKKNLGT